MKPELLKAIDSLGKTDQEVEATLLKAKVTGVKSEMCACPVARYIKRKLGLEIVAGSHAIGPSLNSADKLSADYVWVYVSTPPHIRTFMDRFDEGLANKELYQRRDSPIWTAPIRGWQYRLKYIDFNEEKKRYGHSPEAETDGVRIFADPQQWVVSPIGRLDKRYKHAKLRKAIALYLKNNP